VGGARIARREATDALVAELERMSPERQALVILALIDREDRPDVSLLAQAAESGPKNVRLTAIQAMRQQGDVSCVPVLLAAALESDEELANAASEALMDLPGADVDADLAARLGAAEGKTRLSLIQLAGLRGIAAAVPALRKAADDRDGTVRAAAFQSLGDTISFDELSWLIDRTVGAKNPEELAMVGDALKAASGRMPDRDACATKLAAAMPRAATRIRPSCWRRWAPWAATGRWQRLSRRRDRPTPTSKARQLSSWETG
jgi:HEAT repeat protein